MSSVDLSRCSLLAVSILLGACSTPALELSHASQSIGEILADQIETRTDPRNTRILVREFQPCAPATDFGDDRLTVRSMHVSRRLKHHLMSSLARRLFVIEDHLFTEYPDNRSDDRRREEDPYEVAKDLRATAVLVGNYTITDEDDLIIMARLVDVETQQVMATAEAVLPIASIRPVRNTRRSSLSEFPE